MTVRSEGIGRLPMLDGWRGLSILLVLVAHLLPLGPKTWGLNEPVGALGMAIFFCLSGFLIISMLLRDPSVPRFLIRRLARIVPLAWLALAFAFVIDGTAPSALPANFFFYANLPPFWLAPRTSHFWSLCVEMQFYIAISALVFVGRARSLALVPVAAIVFTLSRIESSTLVSIVTWLRIDEILAGGILALILHAPRPNRFTRALDFLPFPPLFVMFLFSTSAMFPILNYARPYLTATMVGVTVVRSVPIISRTLTSRSLSYIASVSYAVYVIHHFTMFGWLSSGSTMTRYAKRPLALAVTFGLSHISTFYFERRITDWAHRHTRRPDRSS